jgi:hypothetical protein
LNVGEHSLDPNASFEEPIDRPSHERRGGLLALVLQRLDVRDPRAVVDRDVEVVIA